MAYVYNSDSDEDPMGMSTLATLDNPVVDEYDMDEMEDMEERAAEDPTTEFTQPQITWDHPDFDDISAWETFQPSDENLQTIHHNSPSLAEGESWRKKDQAIYAVRKYSILNHVEYFMKESDKTLMVFECLKTTDGCPWRVRIAVTGNRNYWVVRKNKHNHICQHGSIMLSNRHLNKKYIADEIAEAMSASLRFDARQIRANIRREYGYEISYLKAWQAKQLALVKLFGEWDASFNKLPHLMQTLVDYSPDTFVKWDVEPLNNGAWQVNRVFWAFAEPIKAFKHCRPVLSIDGTHMYGKWTGTLLVAVGLDANNHLLPVCFAVVESESNSTWKWFMSCIREGVTEREGLCIVSDRHKGILAAMREPEWSPPHAYHRVCVRHLQSNFMSRVHDLVLEKKLGHVAYQRKQLKFRAEYAELMDIMDDLPQARKWLEDHELSLWSQAHDVGGIRWGSMTTNASECFNDILKGGRDLSISSLVMFTFRQTAGYFVERQQSLYDGHGSLFPPKIRRKLDKLCARANFHQVMCYDKNRAVYEVTTKKKMQTWTVKMFEGTCSCGKWELLHYPCSHAMAACKYERVDYTDYVAPEYKLDAYHATWQYNFNPLPHESLWRPYAGPVFFPNPRYKRNKVGRNPSRRIRNEMDQRHVHGESSTQGASSSSRPSRSQCCTLCHQAGHNRRACPNRPSE
ncbi:unnamed protein product [Rhodiola kirilowii]